MKQIVHLGGLGDERAEPSAHLRSPAETGRVLRFRLTRFCDAARRAVD